MSDMMQKTTESTIEEDGKPADQPDNDERTKNNKNPTENVPKVHPRQDLIDNYKIPENFFHEVSRIKTKLVATIPCSFITTAATLSEAIEQILLKRVIGLDMKCDQNGTIPELSLIQISTKNHNYLIDPIALKENLQKLAEIFLNPKVIKVMNGALDILKMFQLYHNLFFVNIFDISRAIERLGVRGETVKTVIWDKYKIKDASEVMNSWKVRPLPKDHKSQAISDVHHLVPLFMKLKNCLISAKLGEAVLKECNRMCGIIFQEETKIDDIFPDMVHMKADQSYALNGLDSWRHRVARKENKCVDIILGSTGLRELVMKLPTRWSKIKEFARSWYVSEHIREVQEIIFKALQVSGPCNVGFIPVKSPEPRRPRKKTRFGARLFEDGANFREGSNSKRPRYSRWQNCSPTGFNSGQFQRGNLVTITRYTGGTQHSGFWLSVDSRQGQSHPGEIGKVQSYPSVGGQGQNYPGEFRQGQSYPGEFRQGPNYPSVPQQRPNYPSVPQQGPNYPSAPQQRPNYPSAPQQVPNYPSTPQQGPNYPSAPQQGPNYPSAPPQGQNYPGSNGQTQSYPGAYTSYPNDRTWSGFNNNSVNYDQNNVGRTGFSNNNNQSSYGGYGNGTFSGGYSYNQASDGRTFYNQGSNMGVQNHQYNSYC